MASQGLKILVVDCVEKEALPLGGVEGWFRAALKKCDSRVEVKTVRASRPDWEKEVAWADAVMISGSPRDAFADDEWTHGLMAKVALPARHFPYPPSGPPQYPASLAEKRPARPPP